MRTDNNEGWKPRYNFASLGRGCYTEGTVLLMYVHKESSEEKQNQTIWGRNEVNWNYFAVTDCTENPNL